MLSTRAAAASSVARAPPPAALTRVPTTPSRLRANEFPPPSNWHSPRQPPPTHQLQRSGVGAAASPAGILQQAPAAPAEWVGGSGLRGSSPSEHGPADASTSNGQSASGQASSSGSAPVPGYNSRAPSADGNSNGFGHSPPPNFAAAGNGAMNSERSPQSSSSPRQNPEDNGGLRFPRLRAFFICGLAAVIMQYCTGALQREK